VKCGGVLSVGNPAGRPRGSAGRTNRGYSIIPTSASIVVGWRVGSVGRAGRMRSHTRAVTRVDGDGDGGEVR
jgi:hypothetical protein